MNLRILTAYVYTQSGPFVHNIKPKYGNKG